jgi:hypothetical protein
MMVGTTCCITAACAPSTTRVKVPPLLRPVGKRIDSGADTVA